MDGGSCFICILFSEFPFKVPLLFVVVLELIVVLLELLVILLETAATELEHFVLDKVFDVNSDLLGDVFELGALEDGGETSLLLLLPLLLLFEEVELVALTAVWEFVVDVAAVLEDVVEVAASCLISFLSFALESCLLGVLVRFSGTTGDVGGVSVKCLFLEFMHFSQSSVSGFKEIRFGHALHVVHSVSMKLAKLSSSFMRRGEGILTCKI